jgi:hypothetical protein
MSNKEEMTVKPWSHASAMMMWVSLFLRVDIIKYVQ